MNYDSTWNISSQYYHCRLQLQLTATTATSSAFTHTDSISNSTTNTTAAHMSGQDQGKPAIYSCYQQWVTGGARHSIWSKLLRTAEDSPLIRESFKKGKWCHTPTQEYKQGAISLS